MIRIIMKTKFLLFLFVITAFISCNDRSNVDETPTALEESQLYYEYDYASHTATVVKTPNDFPEVDYYYSMGQDYSEYSDNIVIPSYVEYQGEKYKVVGINIGAFARSSKLRSVKIPSTIETIGKYAFTGCPNLETITVDKNNPKYDSRYNCNAIIETATNTLLFGSNKMNIPSNVKIIGPYSIIRLTFEEIIIPEGVKEIDHHTLQRLPNLKMIDFPNSLETIDEDALTDCTSLKSVTLGRNVKSIFDAFLAGNKSLETVTCLSVTPPVWGMPHVDIPNDVILYVPDQSVDLYSQDQVWGKHFIIRPLFAK